MGINKSLLIITILYSFAVHGATTEDCQKLVNKHTDIAEMLKNKYPDLTAKTSADNYVKALARLKGSRCNLMNRDAIVSQLLVALGTKTMKVGIILPLTGYLSGYGKNILAGIETHLSQSANKNIQLIIKDNASNANLDERLFAELTMHAETSLVIGGFQSASAPTLSKLAESLGVPTLILGPPPINTDTENKKFSFYVFPTIDQLAAVLASSAKRKNLNRIAILAPHGQVATALSEELKRQSAALGLTIVRDVRYNASDFSSMENAVKTVAQTHANQRPEEFRTLLALARAKSEREGVAFNPSIVAIPPLIDFDALFVPDNFKNVRHLVQILKYSGVRQLRMFGHHEWRSQALLDPYDAFLDGSFFADFVGSYQHIPASMKPTSVSGLLASNQEVETLDFKIIGWRAALIAQSGLSNITKRYEVATNLTKIVDENHQFFGRGRVFFDKKVSRWPTHILAVRGQSIYVEQ